MKRTRRSFVRSVGGQGARLEGVYYIVGIYMSEWPRFDFLLRLLPPAGERRALLATWEARWVAGGCWVLGGWVCVSVFNNNLARRR